MIKYSVRTFLSEGLNINYINSRRDRCIATNTQTLFMLTNKMLNNNSHNSIGPDGFAAGKNFSFSADYFPSHYRVFLSVSFFSSRLTPNFPPPPPVGIQKRWEKWWWRGGNFWSMSLVFHCCCIFPPSQHEWGTFQLSMIFFALLFNLSLRKLKKAK